MLLTRPPVKRVPKKTFGMVVPVPLLNWVQNKAAESGKSATQVILDLIREAIKQEEQHRK